MPKPPYKRGVCDLIDRVRQLNPEVGDYLNHTAPDDREFMTVHLSNGILLMHKEVAHSQEVFHMNVSDEWISEIEKTFAKGMKPDPSIAISTPFWKKWIGGE